MHVLTPTTLPNKRDEAYKYTDLGALLRGLTPVYADPKNTLVITGTVDITTTAHVCTIRIPAHMSVKIIDDVMTNASEWTSRAIHMIVENGAYVEYIHVVDGHGMLTDHIQIDAHENARVHVTHLHTRAHMVRTDLTAHLHGAHAQFDLHASQILGNGQHGDLTVLTHHVAADCSSTQTVRNVIGAGGRGVFQGKIHVDPHAQRTDAHQLSQTLLLGAGAEMNTKPELEIYADDVSCAHGATTGALDDTQIFYLMSRGLSYDQASAMLTEGFIASQFDHLDDTVRTLLTTCAHAAIKDLAS